MNRELLRTIFRWARYPALVIFALNLEKLAQDNQWDSVLSDHWRAILNRILDALQSGWVQYPAAFVLGCAFILWADGLLRRKQRTEDNNKEDAESTKLTPVSPKIDYEKVKLIAPPFRYELTWAPENSLQIITDIKFIPSGRPKPDSRLPTFFLKNLTTDFLRNVRASWRMETSQIEATVAFSPAFRQFNATIITDFFPSAPTPSFIPYKAINLQNDRGSGSAFTYQIEEIQQIEFIDPAGETPICPHQVFAAAELYLTAKLAGADRIVTASVDLRCDISIGGNPPVPFKVKIWADVIRPAFGQPALAARLRISADPFEPK